MPHLKCDKCKQTHENPSRVDGTCNRHQTSESTGYCQGTLRPIGQMATGSYVAPPAGEKRVYVSR